MAAMTVSSTRSAEARPVTGASASQTVMTTATAMIDRAAGWEGMRGLYAAPPPANGCHLDVADQADQIETLQGDPGEIEFIPCEAVPRRDGMRMVIVVPALAEREERHPPVVARVVSRVEPARTPHVRSRVHQPR